MSLKQDIQQLLAKEGVRPNKNRGQHFLVNAEDLRIIAKKARIVPGQTVLEVGAGVGNLTHELVAAGARVIAVEKDPTLASILKRLTREAPIRVVEDDIRNVDPATLPKPYTVVGNVPYYISAPIVRQFLDTPLQPKRIVLTLQREVGERLAVSTPQATFLSNFVSLFANITLGPVIDAKHFWPKPKVDSVVVTLSPHTVPSKKTGVLIKLMRAGFRYPRKTLYNNLIRAGYAAGHIWAALHSLGLTKKARAHELSLDRWKSLSSLLEWEPRNAKPTPQV